MSDLPPAAVRADITAKLTDLVAAMESHPAWEPASARPQSLFYVWDFANRSRYIMTELDNIREGRPLQHPDQIPKNAKAASPEQAAQMSFTDVCTRCMTMHEIVQNPLMLGLMGLGQVDFGDDITAKSDAVSSAIRAASS